MPVGESPTNYIVLVDDLRDIVTALWASGAEAITISGGRPQAARRPSGWWPRTSIYGVGSAILVNTAFLSPPFRIEAIGPDGLHDRFLADPSYLARVARRIEAYGLQFASEPRDELTLPAFIGNTRLRWGVPREEAELMAARIAQVSLFVVALIIGVAARRPAALAGASDRAVEPVGTGALDADRDGLERRNVELGDGLAELRDADPRLRARRGRRASRTSSITEEALDAHRRLRRPAAVVEGRGS